MDQAAGRPRRISSLWSRFDIGELCLHSSKKGSKMKKTVGQIKNGLPGAGQDKDTVTAVQRVSIKHATKFQQQ